MAAKPPKVGVPKCNSCKAEVPLFPFGRNELCATCLPSHQEGLARMAKARIEARLPLSERDREALLLYPEPRSPWTVQ